jgi:phosphoserine aminotransferase
MKRLTNFNAGPAVLPGEVLQQAAQAVIEYAGTGLSILELPHRSREFKEIIEESKGLVKELCGLNNDYEVIWLQGGGRMQFCMVPMNFLSAGASAGYIDSGKWAANAARYAAYYGNAQVLASSVQCNYNRLPDWPASIDPSLSYIHFTTNNTIYGTQWHSIPDVSVPLVADMSSDIFSRRQDYAKCAMFYAVAQKNIGAAGNTLVVVRKDMLARIKNTLPPMLDFRAHVQENSILNTANVFGIYVSLLMLRWTKAQGIDAIERNNAEKAALLYQAIDNSSIFRPFVTVPEHRSMMNVCFNAISPEAEKGLLSLCAENGITGIKGHRSAGGFRVSLYNAVTLKDVEQLVAVIREADAGS